jgi:TetR/AcrR family transcriptional repressor of lmrAB and yxaGH operons
MATHTRTRMLDATARLLQQRGYHGTSLNDILAESGAPRGSLYFHFPGGKDQLVVEASRTSVERVTKHRRDVLAGAASPAAAVRAFADGMVLLLEETDYQLGCPIAPIVLDGTSEVADLAELCRATFAEWIGLLRESFAEAGIAKQRADALALLTQSSFEGALLIARAYRDSSPVRTVAGEVEAMVAAATPRAVGKSPGSPSASQG